MRAFDLRRCLCAGVSAVMLATTGATALAQGSEETPEARRAREQLQRTRAALAQATSERETLQAQKQALEQNQSRLNAQAARAQAQERAQVAQLQREVQQLKDEALQQDVLVAALREQLGELVQLLVQTDSALRAQLALAQRETNERAAVTRAVAQILERSTALASQSEAARQQTHAAGLQAIEQVRREMGTKEISWSDPLGLRAVRRENTTDLLREALDAPRAKPTSTPQPKP